MNASNQKWIRGTEFLFLFFGIPLFITLGWQVRHPVLLLIPVSFGFILYFRFKKDFRFKSLIHWNIYRKIIKLNALIILLAAIFLLLYVWIFERENLFNLPTKNFRLWLFLCFSYPLFSASIQELIYRTFIFSRYASLFKNKYILILASSLAFSFVHIIYYSLISLIFTFLAGLYLSWLYEKTQSMLFTTIVHGLLGDLIFTIGLGQHFWLNMNQYMG